jgi:hypothetical protein
MIREADERYSLLRQKPFPLFTPFRKISIASLMI